MSQRLTEIKDFLTGSAGEYQSDVHDKRPDDIVIVSAHRSAIAKGFRGSFKDVNSDFLLLEFLKVFFDRLPSQMQDHKELIGEVACGNVLNRGAGATEHRSAMLAAGLPYQIPFIAVNRQCSSGLTAVNDIANKIRLGQIDIGLACGVESMSKNYMLKDPLGLVSEELRDYEATKRCMLPMGITNENIASKYTITREMQDEFASNSYNKAEKALEQGLFQEEILPITLPDGKVVSRDEGPRKGASPESLGKLKPAFIRDKGTTTAGNSSQISDGVAAVLLARRSVAEKLDLPVLGKYVAFQAVGVPPEIMGVGPAYAIPRVLKDVGLNISDIDVYEINEAFAAQALYCIHTLGIDPAKVNPRGGAIALGHPLGCTGTRQVATILRELKEGQVGVVSMCVGTGMGAAAVFVKE